MAKRFITPFAEAGDRATMPDTPTGTNSNYQTGYPSQYEEDPVANPTTAKFVERDKSNQLYNDITANIKEWQEHTYPAFITSAVNGGVPFAYKKDSIVTYLGVDYVSLVDSNEDVPPSSKWEIYKLSQAHEFDSISAMTSSLTVFPAGKLLHVIDIDAQYLVTAGASPDTANPPLTAGLYALLKNGDNPYKYGAIGDGVADDTVPWGLWEAASVNVKTILIGSYLVSGVVKHYDTPTFVNSANSNHAAGYRALELNVDGVNNTALGKFALSKTNGTLPEGSDNTAVGTEALKENTVGYRSVAVGYKSCASNVGHLLYGNSLTAVGYETLFNNLEGKDNTALGYLSMFFNEGGSGNTAIGYRSLWSNTGTTDGSPAWAAIDGSFNTTIGYESMLSNTLGNSNTATGWRSLFLNTIGTRNTANGQEALRSNIDGNNNVAIGYKSLHDSVGDDNVAIGYQALTVNIAGTNVAVGKDALLVNTTGLGNTAIGYQSLDANVSANFCTGVGRGSLSASTGNNNTAIGYNAAVSITTAISCTALGFTALLGNSTFSNCTGVGNNSAVTAANQVQLGDSATTTYAYGAVQDRSDMRDKLDIKDLTDAHIEFFMAVEWKQYRMNYREAYRDVLEDGTIVERENDESRSGKRYHIGAIAQQVESAMKKHNIDFAGLQHHSISGGEDIYSIGYQEFIGIQGLIIQRQQGRLLSIEERLTKAGL